MTPETNSPEIEKKKNIHSKKFTKKYANKRQKNQHWRKANGLNYILKSKPVTPVNTENS